MINHFQFCLIILNKIYFIFLSLTYSIGLPAFFIYILYLFLDYDYYLAKTTLFSLLLEIYIYFNKID